MCVYLCLKMCLCFFVFVKTWHLAIKSCHEGCFFLLVLFLCDIQKHWQRTRTTLLMQVARWRWCLLNDQDSYAVVAVVGEGWPLTKKEKYPAVQRWGWINPSVVTSFHVEVMLSKSFGTRLPGWRRDGWMSGVVTEYPCSWLNQTSWLFRNWTPSFACWKLDQSWRFLLEWCRGSSWDLHQYHLLKSTDQ